MRAVSVSSRCVFRIHMLEAGVATCCVEISDPKRPTGPFPQTRLVLAADEMRVPTAPLWTPTAAHGT